MYVRMCACAQLDERKDGDSIQQALAKLTGRRTVPNVRWRVCAPVQHTCPPVRECANHVTSS
jgi:hypothetical protein